MKIQRFLQSSPLFALHRVYAQAIGDFQRTLSTEGVHFVEALILTGLFFEEASVRPSTLADTFACGRPNVSHAIRSLEASGWVERANHGSDARGYMISITRLGRKKAQKLIHLFDIEQARLESIGGDELNAALRKFLGRGR